MISQQQNCILALIMSKIRNVNEATLSVKKGNWDYRLS